MSVSVLSPLANQTQYPSYADSYGSGNSASGGIDQQAILREIQQLLDQILQMLAQNSQDQEGQQGQQGTGGSGSGGQGTPDLSGLADNQGGTAGSAPGATGGGATSSPASDFAPVSRATQTPAAQSAGAPSSAAPASSAGDATAAAAATPASPATESAEPNTTSNGTDHTDSPSGAGNASAAGSTDKVAVDGGGPNSITLNNTTDKPMQIAFFKNQAAGTHPNFDGAEQIVTVPPGGSVDVSMPQDWQGRAQKWDGSTQDYANWAEINFEGSTGKIWFDESDIPGRNASIKMSTDDGQVAGTDKSVLGDAPSSIVKKDSAGNDTIAAPQWFTGETNQQSVDFLDNAVGTSTAYVLPDDNNAVRVSNSKHMTIDFGNA